MIRRGHVREREKLPNSSQLFQIIEKNVDRSSDLFCDLLLLRPREHVERPVQQISIEDTFGERSRDLIVSDGPREGEET